ncbi:NHL repeat containing protein (fragment) [Burkholderiales bacterium]
MRYCTRIPLVMLILAACLVSASCDYGYDYYYACSPCAANVTSYMGTVSGLQPGTSVTLLANTGEQTSLSANGSFSVATLAPPGFPAQLGVLFQPPGQNCVASNSAPDANGVVHVTVTCSAIGAGAIPSLAVVAGMLQEGATDGSGTAASFQGPFGIAVDGAGNVYVADSGNNTVRAITPSGVVSTLAGSAGVIGSADGTGAGASFNAPAGVATDSAGNVYVADTGNETIRKITPSGVVTTLAGSPGLAGTSDGTGSAARFWGPIGIAADAAGNLYVADDYANTIRVITPSSMVTTLAGTGGVWGSVDGTGAAARFNRPRGVAVDGAGNVYVADTGNNTIRKIAPGAIVSTLAGTAGVWGSADGAGAAASFARPLSVANNAAGDVYVADYQNSTIRKITASAVVTTVVGVPGRAVFSAGTLPGSLAYPAAVVVSATSLFLTTNNGVAVVLNLP